MLGEHKHTGSHDIFTVKRGHWEGIIEDIFYLSEGALVSNTGAPGAGDLKPSKSTYVLVRSTALHWKVIPLFSQHSSLSHWRSPTNQSISVNDFNAGDFSVCQHSVLSWYLPHWFCKKELRWWKLRRHWNSSWTPLTYVTEEKFWHRRGKFALSSRGRRKYWICRKLHLPQLPPPPPKKKDSWHEVNTVYMKLTVWR